MNLRNFVKDGKVFIQCVEHIPWLKKQLCPDVKTELRLKILLILFNENKARYTFNLNRWFLKNHCIP